MLVMMMFHIQGHGKQILQFYVKYERQIKIQQSLSTSMGSNIMRILLPLKKSQKLQTVQKKFAKKIIDLNQFQNTQFFKILSPPIDVLIQQYITLLKKSLYELRRKTSIIQQYSIKEIEVSPLNQKQSSMSNIICSTARQKANLITAPTVIKQLDYNYSNYNPNTTKKKLNMFFKYSFRNQQKNQWNISRNLYDLILPIMQQFEAYVKNQEIISTEKLTRKHKPIMFDAGLNSKDSNKIISTENKKVSFNQLLKPFISLELLNISDNRNNIIIRNFRGEILFYYINIKTKNKRLQQQIIRIMEKYINPKFFVLIMTNIKLNANQFLAQIKNKKFSHVYFHEHKKQFQSIKYDIISVKTDRKYQQQSINELIIDFYKMIQQQRSFLQAIRGIKNQQSVFFEYDAILINIFYYLTFNDPHLSKQSLLQQSIKLFRNKLDSAMENIPKSEEKIDLNNLHFLEKMKNCKQCMYCKKQLKLTKPRKVKYRCQGCSKTRGRDIPLCPEHTQLFHDNLNKYLPPLSLKSKNKLKSCENILEPSQISQSQKSQILQENQEQRVNQIITQLDDCCEKMFKCIQSFQMPEQKEYVIASYDVILSSIIKYQCERNLKNIQKQ